MLNAASRASLALVERSVENAAGSMSDRAGVAAALYAVSGVLASNPTLRRTLAEASTESDDRAALVRRLFDGKIPAPALDVVVDVVGQRWSTAWDLVDAIEGAGNQILLIDADEAGHLDDVEDQLFRFGRIVAGDSGLRSALDDRTQPADRRGALAQSLLEGKADAVTTALIAQAVRSSAHASAELAVDDLLELTAARRSRSVATVTSAVPLSDAQVARLGDALTTMYGRTIAVRVNLNPDIRGGLIVRVGDELIDGSVSSRLAAVRGGLH